MLLCCSPRTAEGAGLAGIYRGRGAAGASAEQTAPSIPRPELPGTKGTFTHGQRGQRATQALPPRPPVAWTELGGHSDRSQGTRGGLGATSPWAGGDTAGTGQLLVRCRGAGSEDFPVPAFPCTPFPHRAGLCRRCPCPETPILLLSARKRARRASGSATFVHQTLWPKGRLRASPGWSIPEDPRPPLLSLVRVWPELWRSLHHRCLRAASLGLLSGAVFFFFFIFNINGNDCGREIMSSQPD